MSFKSNAKTRKKMANSVNSIKEYVNTYDKQLGYKDYSEDTFINDILYGIGISLNDKYQMGNGFLLFKQRLRDLIAESNTSITSQPPDQNSPSQPGIK